jgi:predicted transcriptional regulator of viral defense system
VEDTSLGPQKGLVLAALAANAAHILNADQIAGITGVERRTASAYLSEFARSGKAVRAGYGRYTIAKRPTKE